MCNVKTSSVARTNHTGNDKDFCSDIHEFTWAVRVAWSVTEEPGAKSTSVSRVSIRKNREDHRNRKNALLTNTFKMFS